MLSAGGRNRKKSDKYFFFVCVLFVIMSIPQDLLYWAFAGVQLAGSELSKSRSPWIVCKPWKSR